jgi:UDP-glucose 4-epimerase
MNNKQISRKHVLITGGAGFIGSHLAEKLLSDGCYVTVIDDLSTGKFENIAHLVGHSRFRFAIDNISNEIVLDRLTSECDEVYHLAAAVGVMLIVEQPVRTIETNIMGTEAVLRAALRYRAKVFIASTSEVYGKGNRVPFNENDDVVLGPTSRSRWAYAASKMVDEFLALAYYREHGLPVVIFRLFNTVGPRQTGQYGMVIPRFIEQVYKGQPLTVFGDGQQTRCFLHVADAIEAILALSDCDEAIGQVFNIGSTEEIEIRDLAKMVLRIAMIKIGNKRTGRTPTNGSSIYEKILYVPYEDAYAIGFEDMHKRVPDISRIQQLTGWQPSHSLEHILDDMITSHINMSNNRSST